MNKKSQIHITQILLILLAKFCVMMQDNAQQSFKLLSENFQITKSQGQQQFLIDLTNYFSGILQDVSSSDFIIKHPLQLNQTIKANNYQLYTHGMPYLVTVLKHSRFILDNRMKGFFYAKLVDSPEEEAFAIIGQYQYPVAQFHYFNQITINKQSYLVVTSLEPCFDQVKNTNKFAIYLELFKLDLENMEFIKQLKIKSFESDVINLKRTWSNKNQLIVEYLNETEIFTFFTYQDAIKYQIQTISTNLSHYDKLFFSQNLEFYLSQQQNYQLQIFSIEQLHQEPLWAVTPPEVNETLINSPNLQVLKVDKDELIILYLRNDYYQIVRYQNNETQIIWTLKLQRQSIYQTLYFEGMLLIQSQYLIKNFHYKLTVYHIDFDIQQDTMVYPLQVFDFSDKFYISRIHDKSILILNTDRQNKQGYVIQIFNFSSTYQIQLLNSTQVNGSIYLIPFEYNQQESTTDQQFEIKIEFVNSRQEWKYIILIFIIGIILNSFLFCTKQTYKKIHNQK